MEGIEAKALSEEANVKEANSSGKKRRKIEEDREKVDRDDQENSMRKLSAGKKKRKVPSSPVDDPKESDRDETPSQEKTAATGDTVISSSSSIKKKTHVDAPKEIGLHQGTVVVGGDSGVVKINVVTEKTTKIKKGPAVTGAGSSGDTDAVQLESLLSLPIANAIHIGCGGESAW